MPKRVGQPSEIAAKVTADEKEQIVNRKCIQSIAFNDQQINLMIQGIISMQDSTVGQYNLDNVYICWRQFSPSQTVLQHVGTGETPGGLCLQEMYRICAKK